MAKPKLAQLGLKLPADLLRRLRERADAERRPIVAVATRAFERELADPTGEIFSDHRPARPANERKHA